MQAAIVPGSKRYFTTSPRISRRSELFGALLGDRRPLDAVCLYEAGAAVARVGPLQRVGRPPAVDLTPGQKEEPFAVTAVAACSRERAWSFLGGRHLALTGTRHTPCRR